MTKLLIVGFNLVILISYKIFFGGDVSATQHIPDQAKPGETFMVKVEIKKGDREGFAKWQQKLPEGFIATSVATEGATFSFKNQEVKLIWMTLPKKEAFEVKYEVKTAESTSGNFKLKGKFSYIEENERKDVTTDEHAIAVGSEPIAMNEDNSEATETNDGEENELATNQSEENDKSALELQENIPQEDKKEDAETIEQQESIGEVVTDNDEVKISRSIQHISDGNYEVKLTVEKGEFNSFGKIEEYLPPNYIASEMTSKDGIFSFNNKVMKLLWMTLPKDKKIEIKYKLQSTSDELDTGLIHGVFSYLDGDESRQVKLKASKFKNFYGTDPVVVDLEEEPSEKEENMEMADELVQTDENKEVESINDTQVNESISEIEQEEEKQQELVNEITNIPSPETSINYKVQIAAAHKEVQQQYFVSRHGITESVSIEVHEGWYKYTLGSFNVYKEARDKRNKIWAQRNKINDAFVTAYNSGERISVQEALMISKQKWYK